MPQPFRTARRASSSVLATMLCLACAAVGPAAGPTPAPVTPTTPTTPTTVVLEGSGESRGHCGVLDPATDFYGARVTPHHGSPGAVLKVTGTTLRTEGWRWAEASKIELWWSREKLGIPGEGDSVLLGTIVPGTACTFETEVRIPDVPPGRYFLTTLVFSREGYGYFGEHRINVG